MGEAGGLVAGTTIEGLSARQSHRPAERLDYGKGFQCSARLKVPLIIFKEYIAIDPRHFLVFR
jgi:hypothetical protein